MCGVVEMVKDGIAIMSSGEFGGMGPFSMTFKADSGKGTGEYFGTHIVDGHHSQESL